MASEWLAQDYAGSSHTDECDENFSVTEGIQQVSYHEISHALNVM